MVIDITPDTIKTAAEVVGALLALVGAVKLMVVPAFRMFSKVRKAFETIDRIDKELSPNSGTSIKDAISRIENRQITFEQRQKAMIAYDLHPIVEENASGHCVSANKAFLQMVGKTLDEVVGQGWIGCVYPDDREKVSTEWERCHKHGREFSLNFRISDLDDLPVEVVGRSYAMRDPSGNSLGFIFTIQPVSASHPVIYAR